MMTSSDNGQGIKNRHALNDVTMDQLENAERDIGVEMKDW